MALFDPNDTVDVMHPQTGQIITMPAIVAQRAGVPADMIVPRQQQVAMPEGTLAGGLVAGQPPINPPPPPPPPPPQKIGPAPGAPSTPYAGEIASPTPIAAGPGPSAPPAAPPLAEMPKRPDSDVDAAFAGAPSSLGADATPDALRKGGDAEAFNRQKAALEQGDRAGRSAAQIESTFHDAMGGALANERQRLDQIAADRAKEAQANVDRINQKATQIDSSIDAYSKMKIDRSMDHPVIGALGVLLGAIGQGMIRGEKNPALDMLMQTIDRKVQTQIADRNAAGQAIGFQKDSLNNLRQQFTDRNAYYDGLVSAEVRRTIALGDELTQKSQSQQVKANWLKSRADLQEKAATLYGSAVDKQVTRDNADRTFAEEQRAHRASEGIAGGHLALARRSADLEDKKFGFDQTKWADEVALKIAELKDKGDPKAKLLQAQADAISERGVFAPTGVKTEKTQDGTTVATPTFAPLVQQDGVTPFLVPKEEHKEFADRQSAIVSGLDAVDKLRKLRHLNGGNLTNSEDALEATQEYARYVLALHEGGGIKRLSGEAVDLFKDVASGGRSPNSLRAVQKTLENSRKDLVDQYNLNLRGANYTGKRINFEDPLKQIAPSESDISKIKTPLDIPVPNMTDENSIKRSIRLLEEQMRSDDPKVKQQAGEALRAYSIKAPNKRVQELATKAIGRYATGQSPIMPDPEKYPKLYGEQ